MTHEINVWALDVLSDQKRQKLLERTESDLSSYLNKVQPIVDQVKLHGDSALLEFTSKFDGVSLTLEQLKVTEEEFEAAANIIDKETTESIRFAAENIRNYHESQKPGEMTMQEVRKGSFVGERFLAIPSVACYVPRGKGSFPSVLLMNAIPALVAGVKKTWRRRSCKEKGVFCCGGDCPCRRCGPHGETVPMGWLLPRGRGAAVCERRSW